MKSISLLSLHKDFDADVYGIPDSLHTSKGEPFIEYAKNPQELFNRVQLLEFCSEL